MASERARALAATACVALVGLVLGTVLLEGLARNAEAAGANMWITEEWLQLLDRGRFEGQGDGRLVLTGSSEGREGFLEVRMADAFEDRDVFNLSYSNNTLPTFNLVLEYLEAEYGAGSVPSEIVVGVSPWFLVGDPTLEDSYFPRTLNRYTPNFRFDVRDTTVVAKPLSSRLVSRYRHRAHQGRRYRAGLAHFALTGLPGIGGILEERTLLPVMLGRANYHHMDPMSKDDQLAQLRGVGRSGADPGPDRVAIAGQLDRLVRFADRHGSELYFVDLPQSSVMRRDYFGSSYDEYRAWVSGLFAGERFLDLSDYLTDDEFYDLVHPTRSGAERLSDRVAAFVRDR